MYNGIIFKVFGIEGLWHKPLPLEKVVDLIDTTRVMKLLITKLYLCKSLSDTDLAELIDCSGVESWQSFTDFLNVNPDDADLVTWLGQ